MSLWYCSVCHSEFEEPENPAVCSSCRSDRRMIVSMEELPATLEEVRDLARKKMKGILTGVKTIDEIDSTILF